MKRIAALAAVLVLAACAPKTEEAPSDAAAPAAAVTDSAAPMMDSAHTMMDSTVKTDSATAAKSKM